jgi:hypothetical protein
MKVYQLNPFTGERHLWKELMPSDAAGVVALFTIKVTPDGRAYGYSYHRMLSAWPTYRNPLKSSEIFIYFFLRASSRAVNEPKVREPKRPAGGPNRPCSLRLQFSAPRFAP